MVPLKALAKRDRALCLHIDKMKMCKIRLPAFPSPDSFSGGWSCPTLSLYFFSCRFYLSPSSPQQRIEGITLSTLSAFFFDLNRCVSLFVQCDSLAGLMELGVGVPPSLPKRDKRLLLIGRTRAETKVGNCRGCPIGTRSVADQVIVADNVQRSLHRTPVCK